MLSIAVESKNYYFRLGLISIIDQISKSTAPHDYQILGFPVANMHETADIVFTEDVAIVNIKEQAKNSETTVLKNSLPSAVHITFNASGMFIEDVYSFIMRVFSVSQLTQESSGKSKLHQLLKVRKSAQLSETEKRLVILSGHGHEIMSIARLMRCSTNSAYTYRRNAMKKLGMENRLQFYKYVQILALFKQHNNIFICL